MNVRSVTWHPPALGSPQECRPCERRPRGHDALPDDLTASARASSSPAVVAHDGRTSEGQFSSLEGDEPSKMIRYRLTYREPVDSPQLTRTSLPKSGGRHRKKQGRGGSTTPSDKVRRSPRGTGTARGRVCFVSATSGPKELAAFPTARLRLSCRGTSACSVRTPRWGGSSGKCRMLLG